MAAIDVHRRRRLYAMKIGPCEDFILRQEVFSIQSRFQSEVAIPLLRVFGVASLLRLTRRKKWSRTGFEN